MDVRAMSEGMMNLLTVNIDEYTFKHYLAWKSIRIENFRQVAEKAASFAIRCNLGGFIKEILFDEEFGVLSQEKLLFELLKLSIEYRRVRFIRILLAHGEKMHLELVERGSHPIVYIYKVSRGDYYLLIRLIEGGLHINGTDAAGNAVIHLIYQNYAECRSSDFHILERLLNGG